MDVTTLSQLFTVGTGLVAFCAIVVLPLTVMATVVIIGLFRRRVRRSMEATAGSSSAARPTRGVSSVPVGRLGDLEVETIEASKNRASMFGTSRLGRKTRQMRVSLAATFGLSACLLPAAMALIFLFTTGLTPGDTGALLSSIIGFGLFFLESATPVAFALVLALKRQARFLLATLFGLLAVLWVVGRMTGTDPVGIWLIIAGLPAAFVVLLNTRRLRAVGPMILAATLFLVFGLSAGVALATFQALELLEVRFVREDLAALPIWEAGWKWMEESEDLQTLTAGLMQVASDPSQHIVVENPDAESAGKVIFFGIVLFAAVLAASMSWGFMRSFARSYERHTASDQMLSIDTVLLIFALWCFLFVPFLAWISVVAIPAAFLGYRYLSRWRLKHRRATEAPPTAHTLLLLRVFGFDRRAQRLLQELEHRWRFLGPIRVTASPDLAYSTIRPHEFLEFLNGRLTRRFITNEDELRARLAGPVRPDIDGSYRIEDFYCHDDTWRMTVSMLGEQADAVAMDLRSFSPENRGCIFEIENLIATVPVRRIVLLIDDSTDVPLLEQTLQSAWRDMPSDSPNSRNPEDAIRLLRASSRHGQTAESLLGLLCADFARSR